MTIQTLAHQEIAHVSGALGLEDYGITSKYLGTSTNTLDIVFPPPSALLGLLPGVDTILGLIPGLPSLNGSVTLFDTTIYF